MHTQIFIFRKHGWMDKAYINSRIEHEHMFIHKQYIHYMFKFIHTDTNPDIHKNAHTHTHLYMFCVFEDCV